jgi:hypothetical protein
MRSPFERSDLHWIETTTQNLLIVVVAPVKKSVVGLNRALDRRDYCA